MFASACQYQFSRARSPHPGRQPVAARLPLPVCSTAFAPLPVLAQVSNEVETIGYGFDSPGEGLRCR